MSVLLVLKINPSQPHSPPLATEIPTLKPASCCKQKTATSVDTKAAVKINAEYAGPLRASPLLMSGIRADS